MKIFFLLLLTISSFGQHELGIKIDGGISKVNNSLTTANSKKTILFSPSGRIGISYNYNFEKLSTIGIDLMFTQIEGKERTEMDLYDINSNYLGKMTDNTYTHISYIGVPFYYRVRAKKISIDLGPQMLFTLTSSGKATGQVVNNGTVTNQWENKTAPLHIDPFDFGMYTSINYRVRNKFSVYLMGYYGTHNILGSDASWAWRNSQVTIGLKYNVLTPKLKQDNK